MGNRKNLVKILVVSIVCILLGGYISYYSTTSGGSVEVRNIEYVTEDGGFMRGVLYIPNTASPENKVPAVVAMHGYNNTAEMQAINAIELSKRGIIVFAFDSYGHGLSGFPPEKVNNGKVADLGTYSALQYLKTLPYVDLEKVGMVGHSMGAGAIQDGALRAFKEKANNPETVVPIAILPTSNSFTVNAETGKFILSDYNVNFGIVFGAYDEWAKNMWGVIKGSDARFTPKMAEGMGFKDPEYNTYYAYGTNKALTRDEAINISKSKTLRIVYQPQIDHPAMTFNDEAVKSVLDFFEITLCNGSFPVTTTNLSWSTKELGTGLSFIAFFVFMVSLGLIILRAPYFKQAVVEEPNGITNINQPKDWIRYWVIYFIGLLPAPLLFNILIGYPFDNRVQGRTVDILLDANWFFPMPAANGVYLLNIVVGAILLLIYILTFMYLKKTTQLSIVNTGLYTSKSSFLRMLLLSVIIFACGYSTLLLCSYFFMSDFRFFVFSIKPLILEKWWIYLRYLPSFIFFYVISSMLQNTFTRVNNYSEWKNYLLIIFSSIGGLLVLFLIDTISLFATGAKVFLYVPGTENTTALAGLFVWNFLFILPIAAIISRIFFKATGSVWCGGLLNAMIVTLFTISNTVVAINVY